MRIDHRANPTVSHAFQQGSRRTTHRLRQRADGFRKEAIPQAAPAQVGARSETGHLRRRRGGRVAQIQARGPGLVPRRVREGRIIERRRVWLQGRGPRPLQHGGPARPAELHVRVEGRARLSGHDQGQRRRLYVRLQYAGPAHADPRRRQPVCRRLVRFGRPPPGRVPGPSLPRPARSLGRGDAGFDPLGLATDAESLIRYRDAELKHARLAMLAAVGWPLGELFQPDLAAQWHAPSLVFAQGGENPSVLNGGLQNVPVVFWAGAVAVAVAAELAGLQAANDGKALGDLGLRAGQKALAAAGIDAAEAELANGRVAMLAVVAYVPQEILASAP